MASVMNGITAVRYVGTFVHSVLQHRECGNGQSTDQLLTRDKLIDAAREYGPFMTLHAQPNGAWVMGEKVTLTTVEGIDYLKCHDDGYACDDLGDLSEGPLA